MDGLFTQLYEPPGGKIALIGSGCSIATEPTAEVSHYYDIAQVYIGHICTSLINDLIQFFKGANTL